MSRSAILVLADGATFTGTAVGAEGSAVGEVVFNTAMTGYQEILTDPSYAGQMVTLTYPHIGNTGTNPEDDESGAVHATGLIVRDVPSLHSNFRATESLQAWLKRRGVVAIADIDTRALTRHLRDKGAQAGCIVVGSAPDRAVALEQAGGCPGLAGMDLAQQVTCREPYEWTESTWSLPAGNLQALAAGGAAVPSAQAPSAASQSSSESLPPAGNALHVVAMDFGVKRNILRLLVSRGCRVTVVPATTGADAIRELAPDGLFLSNGPGDPEPCDYAIEATRTLLAERLPTFGICLGHQILALASGARTQKMKFGHHGANHPVLDTATGRVMISSQNHGFSVDADSLGENLAITHLSLFDQSLQGIRRLDVPAFSFQGHPEASPGPHDVQSLFDHFVALMISERDRATGGAQQTCSHSAVSG